MRVTQLLENTRREVPAGADIESYGLLEKAGYIRQLSSGIFIYMHLALRSLKKIEQIIREEMDSIGGAEINMPVVQPADLWKKTGRYDSIDQSLVRFQDRSERDMVLAMTHEEVVSFLTANEISSYKQLPALIYQFQTKFRDELRARGGLIRVREFVMKDSYSLDSSQEGLQKQYEAHYDAYYRIFARLGIKIYAVLSDVGMMGGSMAHEFMYFTEIGEDTIFSCTSCNYRANKEVAKFSSDNKSAVHSGKAVQKVATPDIKTIKDLSDFFGQPAERFGKCMFYKASFVGGEDKLVAVVIRGDLEINAIKLVNLLKANTIEPATNDEISKSGAIPGFASPVGLQSANIIVVADSSIKEAGELIMGSNEADFHLTNVLLGRDYDAQIVGDIATAFDGASCCRCSTGKLSATRAVEAGNIFQLGTKYSVALGAFFTNTEGVKKPVIMGSYGIGVGRALACVAHEFFDKDGLKFPVTVAPYHVMLVSIPDNPAVAEAADTVYKECQNSGIEILYDDRDSKSAGAGIKFKDSDLRGIPIRVTVSTKSMEKGGAEIKLRGSGETQIVPIPGLVEALKNAIALLTAAINESAKKSPSWESEKHLWQ